jgi:uroporphyrinogen-III synthase
MRDRPLAGIGVLVTRAQGAAGELARRLAALGAEVHQVAALELEPHPRPEGLAQALSRLAGYDALIFTSANGVRFFLPHLAGRGMAPGAAPPALCVGPRTAEAWEEAGGRVLGVPARFTGEDLCALLPDAAGMEMLLLRPEKAATDTAGLLRARGARVDEAVLYRAVPAAGEGAGRLRALLAEGRIRFLTALSPSAVAGLLELAGGAAPLAGLPLLVIGPRTADAAREAGFARVHHPAVHTADALVEMLVELADAGQNAR